MLLEKKTLPLSFVNTLTGKKESFVPLKKGKATLYSCGPTVYGFQHVGNLRAAVFSDVLARALRAAGYDVKKVVNITDVGHLVGDGDEGEDKMAVGAARDNTSPRAIADKYTKQYLEDIKALNVDLSSITFPRATAYIPQQIAMIQKLEEKGLAYRTSDGVYFDTERFPEYGILGNVRGMELQAGARVALGEKKNEHDFVLWRSAKSNDLQQWDSPWGKGNPGWSIECSAMAVSLLGERIDIHTGGQDHVQVHHNNEIAQSEGATGKAPFSRYWLHNAFLTIGGEKISKSLGNTYTLADVRERGINPLALRYLFLQAHYRSPLSFSWDSLAAAETALKRLWKQARQIREDSGGHSDKSRGDIIRAAVFDDLGTPLALDSLWGDLGDHSLSPQQKWGVLLAADQVLGLSLEHPPVEEEAPENVKALQKEREEARNAKDYAKSDELRDHIAAAGWEVSDAEGGSILRRK